MRVYVCLNCICFHIPSTVHWKDRSREFCSKVIFFSNIKHVLMFPFVSGVFCPMNGYLIHPGTNTTVSFNYYSFIRVKFYYCYTVKPVLLPCSLSQYLGYSWCFGILDRMTLWQINMGRYNTIKILKFQSMEVIYLVYLDL